MRLPKETLFVLGLCLITMVWSTQLDGLSNAGFKHTHVGLIVWICVSSIASFFIIRSAYVRQRRK